MLLLRANASTSCEKHRTRFKVPIEQARAGEHASPRQMVQACLCNANRQQGKRTVVERERPRPGRRQRGSPGAESVVSVPQPTSSSYSDAAKRAIANTHCDHGECQHKRHLTTMHQTQPLPTLRSWRVSTQASSPYNDASNTATTNVMDP